MEPLEPMYLLIALVFIPGWVVAWALAIRFGPRAHTVQPGEALRRPPRAVEGAVAGFGVFLAVSGAWIALAVDAPGTGLGGLFLIAGGLATGAFSQAGRLAPVSAGPTPR